MFDESWAMFHVMLRQYLQEIAVEETGLKDVPMIDQVVDECDARIHDELVNLVAKVATEFEKSSN